MITPLHRDNSPVKHGYFYYLGLGMPIPFFIVVNAITLLAIYHAATTRTTEDYLQYGGGIGVTSLLLLGNELLKDHWKSRRIIGWKKLFLLVNLALGIIAGTGALYYSFAASTYDFVKWLIEQWERHDIGPFFVSTVVFVTGLILFWFRLRCRATYGFTEVLVGVSIASYKYVEVSAYTNTALPVDLNFLIALLTAGVYLVVRGLDNIQQGLITEPGDPFLKPIVQWYQALGTAIVEDKKPDCIVSNPQQDR